MFAAFGGPSFLLLEIALDQGPFGIPKGELGYFAYVPHTFRTLVRSSKIICSGSYSTGAQMNVSKLLHISAKNPSRVVALLGNVSHSPLSYV